MRRTKANALPRRSPRLTPDARIGPENFCRSCRIAAIIPPPPVRDNLPAQRKVIDLCHQVLGGGFRIHVPKLGAPGSFSRIQLKTFAKLPHTVHAFSLRKIGGAWLWLEQETGRYSFGYCKWCKIKIGRRYLDKAISKEYQHWLWDKIDKLAAHGA
jgi:hypothetical protein